jgi:hypothetical protein
LARAKQAYEGTPAVRQHARALEGKLPAGLNAKRVARLAGEARDEFERKARRRVLSSPLPFPLSPPSLLTPVGATPFLSWQAAPLRATCAALRFAKALPQELARWEADMGDRVFCHSRWQQDSAKEVATAWGHFGREERMWHLQAGTSVATLWLGESRGYRDT